MLVLKSHQPLLLWYTNKTAMPTVISAISSYWLHALHLEQQLVA